MIQNNYWRSTVQCSLEKCILEIAMLFNKISIGIVGLATVINLQPKGKREGLEKVLTRQNLAISNLYISFLVYIMNWDLLGSGEGLEVN